MKNKQKENHKQQISFDRAQIGGFLNNIADDIKSDFKGFFKDNKNKHLGYHNKKVIVGQQQLLKAKEFDLGPKVNKRKIKNRSIDQKNDEYQNCINGQGQFDETNREKIDKKQKRRTSYRRKTEKLSTQLQRAIKSQQRTKKDEEKEEQKQEIIIPLNEKTEQNEQKQGGLVNFNSMLDKYLSFDDYNTDPVSLVKNYSNKQTTSGTIKTINSQQRSKPLYRTIIESKKTTIPIIQTLGVKRRSQEIMAPSYSKPRTQNGRYRNIQNQNIEKDIQKLHLNELKTLMSKSSYNQILVVSDSSSLMEKINRGNSLIKFSQEIRLKHIKYSMYWKYLSLNPQEHQVYFLFNPNRFQDKPLYFSLEAKFHHTILVSCKLIEEVEQFNKKIRFLQTNFQITTNSQPRRLRYLRKMLLRVKKDLIQNKNIVFLGQKIPEQICKIIVQSLRGNWISRQKFMLGSRADILVGARNALLNGQRSIVMTEQQFWNTLFPSTDFC